MEEQDMVELRCEGVGLDKKVCPLPSARALPLVF